MQLPEFCFFFCFHQKQKNALETWENSAWWLWLWWQQRTPTACPGRGKLCQRRIIQAREKLLKVHQLQNHKAPTEYAGTEKQRPEELLSLQNGSCQPRSGMARGRRPHQLNCWHLGRQVISVRLSWGIIQCLLLPFSFTVIPEIEQNATEDISTCIHNTNSTGWKTRHLIGWSDTILTRCVHSWSCTSKGSTHDGPLIFGRDKRGAGRKMPPETEVEANTLWAGRIMPHPLFKILADIICKSETFTLKCCQPFRLLIETRYCANRQHHSENSAVWELGWGELGVRAASRGLF